MAFDRLRQTLLLRLACLRNLPLLGSLRPRVLALDDDRCVLGVPLRRWTRNHLGSMYFGALAMGADGAAGLLATRLIRATGRPVHLVFGAFEARFLRRATGDVAFVCEEGPRIRALLARVLETGIRQGERLAIRAEVRPPEGPPEVVATFILDLSLKEAR